MIDRRSLVEIDTVITQRLVQIIPARLSKGDVTFKHHFQIVDPTYTMAQA